MPFSDDTTAHQCPCGGVVRCNGFVDGAAPSYRVLLAAALILIVVVLFEVIVSRWNYRKPRA